MASQAQAQRKKIEAYRNMPGHDPAVLAEMKRINLYANTTDPELSKKASQILNAPLT